MPITLPSFVAPNELIQSAWGNAVVDAADYLDEHRPSKGGEAGPENTVTSGADILMVNTFNITAPGVNGRVHAWGGCTYVKSMSGDVFELILAIEGTAVSNPRDPNAGGSTVFSHAASGSLAYTTATSTITVTLSIARVSGSGTATIGTSTPASYLHAIFIPDD